MRHHCAIAYRELFGPNPDRRDHTVAALGVCAIALTLLFGCYWACLGLGETVAFHRSSVSSPAENVIIPFIELLAGAVLVCTLTSVAGWRALIVLIVYLVLFGASLIGALFCVGWWAGVLMAVGICFLMRVIDELDSVLDRHSR